MENVTSQDIRKIKPQVRLRIKLCIAVFHTFPQRLEIHINKGHQINQLSRVRNISSVKEIDI